MLFPIVDPKAVATVPAPSNRENPSEELAEFKPVKPVEGLVDGPDDPAVEGGYNPVLGLDPVDVEARSEQESK